ncbi:MAG: ABC transporter ATP-binding protein [Eubacteriales bacterium]|nr:ABC transporter ATP-binding protein [Eubacteriales bacterium]
MERGHKRRSGLSVMAGLLGMIKPLLGLMLLAVIMGCAGNLMATFITVLGGWGLLQVMGLYEGMSLGVIFGFLAVCAVARGLLRYAEQACNHYIAFKLLARIRHKVFAALRRLAPAKLDGSDRGNLISIITSDIELLEVFYAHSISPVAIGVITSLFMVFFLWKFHPALALAAACYYSLAGAVIPFVNGKRGGEDGQRYRDCFGELNTNVLDNLYGLEEILQYGQKDVRLKEMQNRTSGMEDTNRILKNRENIQKSVTDGVILSSGVIMGLLGGWLCVKGQLEGYECVLSVIAMMSSFGPTAALSALSNNLHQTLASGNRVLDILEEIPVVEDVTDGVSGCQGDIHCDKVSFSYTRMPALENFSAVFVKNKIHGILGKSGCGKSTLLKLIMRFYETDEGCISFGSDCVNDINTDTLRENIAYVTQETFLFHDTIENNLKVAKEDATREEVIEAAKKASVHDFILSLPHGYDTKLAELGESVSGGEKQRIGIARAFLHDSRILLLDEPTSNIDSLNEGIILQALDKEKGHRTIVLVSHRKSTMGIVDEMLAI